MKLANQEWNFESVPPKEVEACFWWEYVRTGLDEALRQALLKSWRSSGSIAIEALSGSAQKRFVAPSVLVQFTDSKELYFSGKGGMEGWQHPAEFFLARLPWMQLPKDLRSDFVNGFPISAYPVLVRTLSSSRGSFEQKAKTDGLERALEWFSYEPFILQASRDTEHTGKVERVVGCTLRVCVDWRFRDSEILEGIGRFLRKNRPREWPEKTRPVGVSLFPEHFRPKTHRAALGWLGVQRRSEAGCRWQDFRRTYGTTTDEPDLRKQVKWAESIIAWMGDSDVRHLESLPAEATRQRRSKS